MLGMHTRSRLVVAVGSLPAFIAMMLLVLTMTVNGSSVDRRAPPSMTTPGSFLMAATTATPSVCFVENAGKVVYTGASEVCKTATSTILLSEETLKIELDYNGKDPVEPTLSVTAAGCELSGELYKQNGNKKPYWNTGRSNFDFPSKISVNKEKGTLEDTPTETHAMQGKPKFEKAGNKYKVDVTFKAAKVLNGFSAQIIGELLKDDRNADANADTTEMDFVDVRSLWMWVTVAITAILTVLILVGGFVFYKYRKAQFKRMAEQERKMQQAQSGNAGGDKTMGKSAQKTREEPSGGTIYTAAEIAVVAEAAAAERVRQFDLQNNQ